MKEEAIFEAVKGTYVGIDLGTSNSVVTYFKNNKFQQILNRGKKIIPSALFYKSETEVIFGEQALKRGVGNPQYLIKEFKRDLGTDVKYTLSFNNSDNSEKSVYIIDTNIFINEPLILENFNKDDEIKLASTVLSELQNLSKKEDVEESATMALESIDKMKSEINILFEESHLDLLPEDLTANTPNDDNDNRILSIAKYFTENSQSKTVLLTNDNGLRLKAETLKLITMKNSDFNNLKSIKENSDKSATVVITPKEATRKLLKYIKDISEKHLTEDITKAVITVPANFNLSQTTLIKDAGEEAGFETIAIQKEPIAVGFAYAMEEEKDKTILIYDFGGGTFDASFLKISNKTLDVIDTNGDNKLGGKDITEKVKEIIFDKILDDTNLDMFDQENSGLSTINFNKNLENIKSKAEEIKIELSEFEKIDVEISNLINSNDNSFNISFKLTRDEFDNEISEIRKKSIDIVKNLINNSGLNVSDIDEIIMAGGTSAIPSIRKSLKDTFGKEPKKSIDTSIVISQGAAIESILLWGTEDEDSIQHKYFKINNTALKDFGIEIKGLKFDVLIPKGTSLPVSIKKEYFTEKDNQESISLKTFQRNSVNQSNKRIYDEGINFVDEIKIENIPPMKVGELIINVTFDLTKDDTLEVSVEIVDNDGNIIKKDKKVTTESSK